MIAGLPSEKSKNMLFWQRNYAKSAKQFQKCAKRSENMLNWPNVGDFHVLLHFYVTIFWKNVEIEKPIAPKYVKKLSQFPKEWAFGPAGWVFLGTAVITQTEIKTRWTLFYMNFVFVNTQQATYKFLGAFQVECPKKAELC